VFWILRRLEKTDPRPDLIMFYGLMSGLGFGIFEGIQYQMGENTRFDSSSTYLLNMLRLTSLPFLHAMWTAIAAYYLAHTRRYPERTKGLVVLAVVFPGVMHGLYDAFSAYTVSFLLAFLSVYLMNYYRTAGKEMPEPAKADS
jgi:RsiW-degrading membrane proteinase PrsW (M82 family)